MNPMEIHDAMADRPPGVPGATEPLVGELLEELTSLQTALEELVAVAGDKLTAMREANTEALERCTAREAKRLQALFRDEPRRKATLARAAQGLLAAGPPAGWLAEIADRVPEPLASRLRARTAGLRDLAAELQRKNRLAATVARHLQSHIRGVFAELAGAAQESVVYGPRGQQEQSHPRCWVDAVG